MRGNSDTVKERLDIVEVIGGYLKLDKAGANYKARCPFHSEKTPSFMVSPERQTFRCFGCGASGDVFTFVGDIEGLDFKETLHLLAERAGVELEYAPAGPGKDEKDQLYRVLDDAALFFESRLADCDTALAYLDSRGVNADSRTKWRLGYAPDDWRVLRAHLRSCGYSDELMLAAGLIKQAHGPGKEPHDTFRDRLMFPLADTGGRIIAFSGRTLKPDFEPKYLNSPDTALFKKSQILYGLDKAKDEVRRRNFAVLVEGQMDLVLSHQSGVGNTVASSGTAFTSEHLERLKRLSSRIVLAFDGDEAGRKAAWKRAQLGLSLGFEVKIAPISEGEDPADIAHRSATAWKDTLRASVQAVDFFLARAAAEPNARARTQAVSRLVLPLIVATESAMERAHFISEVSRIIGTREEAVWDDLKRIGLAAAEVKGSNRALSAPPKALLSKTDLEAYLADLEAFQTGGGSGHEREVAEVRRRLMALTLEEELQGLQADLALAERGGDEARSVSILESIRDIHKKLFELEQSGKML